MNIYHSYFKYWRNFEDKKRFTWVAVTKTVPSDYFGCRYMQLAPIGENFDRVCSPFDEKKFFIEYARMLKTLDRQTVIDELKSFSRDGRDVVMLNWVDLTKNSEGRFAFAWMMGMPMAKADEYDLKRKIDLENKQKNNLGDSIFKL